MPCVRQSFTFRIIVFVFLCRILSSSSIPSLVNGSFIGLPALESMYYVFSVDWKTQFCFFLVSHASHQRPFIKPYLDNGQRHFQWPIQIDRIVSLSFFLVNFFLITFTPYITTGSFQNSPKQRAHIHCEWNIQRTHIPVVPVSLTYINALFFTLLCSN